MSRVARIVGALVCLSAATLTNCADPTDPDADAPPLDIRGSYEVGWFVSYKRTDGVQDLSLPHGNCEGVVEISSHDEDSFRGTISTPNTQLPICHAGSFPIHGNLVRTYGVLSSGTVFNFYDMNIVTDIEPLVGCRYESKAPGNEQYPFRGAGEARDNGRGVRLHLAFSNVYTCPSGRWVITAGFDVPRAGL